jgi:hypothetical protein
MESSKVKEEELDKILAFLNQKQVKVFNIDSEE